MEETRFERNWQLASQEYERKIKTFARNSAHSMPVYITEADVENELRIVLWKVVQSYHPDNGARFNSFVQQCFKHRIATLINMHKTLKRSAEVISLDDESVRSIMENMTTYFTTEDIALMHLEITEWSTDILEAINSDVV